MHRCVFVCVCVGADMDAAPTNFDSQFKCHLSFPRGEHQRTPDGPRCKTTR